MVFGNRLPPRDENRTTFDIMAKNDTKWNHQLNRCKIVYFDTRGQNGRLAHCIFTRAVSEWPVWPHVLNHIFLYKFMRTQVGSPFTDIENALQLNFTRQLSTER